MVYWDFDKKVGEAVIRQGEREFTLNLYDGNAFLIFVDEFKDVDSEDMYYVWLFFADEKHAENCLGLDENGGGNIFDEKNMLVKVRINKKEYRYTSKLVKMLVKAFDEIQIEIYSEELKK